MDVVKVTDKFLDEFFIWHKSVMPPADEEILEEAKAATKYVLFPALRAIKFEIEMDEPGTVSNGVVVVENIKEDRNYVYQRVSIDGAVVTSDLSDSTKRDYKKIVSVWAYSKTDGMAYVEYIRATYLNGSVLDTDDIMHGHENDEEMPPAFVWSRIYAMMFAFANMLLLKAPKSYDVAELEERTVKSRNSSRKKATKPPTNRNVVRTYRCYTLNFEEYESEKAKRHITVECWGSTWAQPRL